MVATSTWAGVQGLTGTLSGVMGAALMALRCVTKGGDVSSWSTSGVVSLNEAAGGDH